MHLELQLHVEIFEYNYIQLLYNIFILCIYIYISLGFDDYGRCLRHMIAATTTLDQAHKRIT